MPSNSTEIYQRVTDAFLAKLKEGVAPWTKPWNVGKYGVELSRPRNLQSGKPYRGVNLFLLGMLGYEDPRWTTFKAAKKQGGKVRKGEKGTLVILWKPIEKVDPTAPNGKSSFLLLRYYTVFNVEQVEWAEPIPELSAPEPEESTSWDPEQVAEDALQAYIDSDDQLSLSWGGNVAAYDPMFHQIMLPDREQFVSGDRFYTTAFHEAVHSTGPELSRSVANKFGSEPYGREELCAEMGACFITTYLGLTPDMEQSAAYIQSWMRAIQNDPEMIVKAAGAAQKAADRILDIAPVAR